MHPIPHRVTVSFHPGSTLEEVKKEPEWDSGHEHRVGFINAQNRVPGLTNSGDEREDDSDPSENIEAELAAENYHEFRDEAEQGKLVKFRDIINAQEDLHMRRSDVHSEGWRYVLNTCESFVKNEEEWPANVERRQKDEDAKKKADQGKIGDRVQEEQEWKRETGEGNKHHDAYGGSDADSERSSGEEQEKSEYEKLREKYSPQEIALLRSLQHEKDYIYNLKQNDGKGKSPVNHSNPLVSIDEADQFSPDNWIPRSSNLIRLTGKHPLIGEPKLTPLFNTGLITPNEFHDVRNHGAVPHLLWELHKLEVSGFHFKDQMLIRSHTPTRPVTRREEDGTFDLVVKTYFPDKRQPGGAMSNILDCMPIGEEIEIRGPTGDISYHGNGKFVIEGKESVVFLCGPPAMSLEGCFASPQGQGL